MAEYRVTVPQVDGDLYFMVDTYFQGATPATCWEGGVFVRVKFDVYKNSVTAANHVETYYGYHSYNYPVQVLSTNYSAGDTFIIQVNYDWMWGLGTFPAKDYTVRLYSKQNLAITDSQGNTNMWHMDGQYPSAFTKSHFRKDTTTWTPEFKPRSLYDVWLVSNNVQQFFSMVLANPHTLYIWYAN